MASRQVNTKIPAKHNVLDKSPSQNELRAMYRAAARNSMDVTGITPSVIGKAWAAGVAKRSANAGASRRVLKSNAAKIKGATDQFQRLADGLNAIQKIRDIAEAQQDPELAKLANDPRIAEAFNRAVAKFRDFMISLTKEVNDSLIREAKAEREATQAARGTPEVGLDVAAHVAAAKLPGFDAKRFNSMDAETKNQYAEATIKLAGIPRAAVGDTFQNEQRRKIYGQDPVPLSNDDLHEHFEGKK